MLSSWGLCWGLGVRSIVLLLAKPAPSMDFGSFACLGRLTRWMRVSSSSSLPRVANKIDQQIEEHSGTTTRK